MVLRCVSRVKDVTRQAVHISKLADLDVEKFAQGLYGNGGKFKIKIYNIVFKNGYHIDHYFELLFYRSSSYEVPFYIVAYFPHVYLPRFTESIVIMQKQLSRLLSSGL